MARIRDFDRTRTLLISVASELFAACSRKSYEQVEEMLAARFPKPDVRDLVRRLPAAVPPAPSTPPALSTPSARPAPYMGSEVVAVEPIELKPGTGSAHAKAAPALARAEPMRGERAQAPTGRRAVKPLSVDRFSVNFTADGEFRELLDEVRALMSHSVPQGDLLTAMKRGLEALRSELLKTRFGVGRKPRRVQLRTVQLRTSEARSASPSPGLSMSNRTRHVPAAVAREVYVRDQGCCTFCADDGRRCGERRLLQLDHVLPHAEGGEPTVGNLRLRCRAHNLHTARADFGKEYVRAAAKRARGSTGTGSQETGRPRRTDSSRARLDARDSG